MYGISILTSWSDFRSSPIWVKLAGGLLITFNMSNSDIIRETPSEKTVTILLQLGVNDHFADDSRYHVQATPHDILYTWGPGQLVPSEHDESILRAICIGGGIIYLKDEAGSLLHWEAGSDPSELPQTYLDCQSKITVGASVTENLTQCSFLWQTWRASCSLVYLAV